MTEGKIISTCKDLRGEVTAQIVEMNTHDGRPIAFGVWYRSDPKKEMHLFRKRQPAWDYFTSIMKIGTNA